jgi:hypothetical protein
MTEDPVKIKSTLEKTVRMVDLILSKIEEELETDRYNSLTLLVLALNIHIEVENRFNKDKESFRYHFAELIINAKRAIS